VVQRLPVTGVVVAVVAAAAAAVIVIIIITRTKLSMLESEAQQLPDDKNSTA